MAIVAIQSTPFRLKVFPYYAMTIFCKEETLFLKGSSGDETPGNFRGLKGPDTTPILDSVQYPHDLKRLDIKQLKTLAHELRFQFELNFSFLDSY